MLASLRRGHPYLLELGGGLLVLAVVNLLLRPKDPGFLAVQPNPALLLVAVVACRHGITMQPSEARRSSMPCSNGLDPITVNTT